jgi:hypothetical protein
MSESTPPSAETTERSTTPEERRAAERYALDSSSVCRLIGDGQEAGPRATVRDLSATGIGLLVEHAVKPGSVLILSLETSRWQLARPLPVRVMHSAPMDDGTWLVGCQFVRKLSEPELQAVLGDQEPLTLS